MSGSATDQSRLLEIGWREWVALPGLGLPAVKAKVDTGARTSALHAHDVRIFRRKGERWVRFNVWPLQRSKDHEITCEAPIVDERAVSDSGGHREKRIVIVTDLELGEMRYPIEMTITRRDTMLFRMLLGRTAMEGRVLVNPAASFLTGRQLARTYNRTSKRDASPSPRGKLP